MVCTKKRVGVATHHKEKNKEQRYRKFVLELVRSVANPKLKTLGKTLYHLTRTRSHTARITSGVRNREIVRTRTVRDWLHRLVRCARCIRSDLRTKSRQ